MKSLRVEWDDEFKGRHQYKVSWAEGCNNGGVGGRVQVGCLVYAYNGGTVAGRDYESIGLW
ncbi:hypothetical protein HER10_EVM0001088 [Colletotrichum scovillei]|uniref:uncharacterized protein n=1 Tax=Colletotrichum scovillei TaxID=1209932 RepID=UPI0015C31160|nr:uncharacterized protein HER10_EVM0001088 [Colletotrichum scovillei]KAF4781618.1 hypothetical protein HER10_EVM0001088 [Colletotrichum scovillei]